MIVAFLVTVIIIALVVKLALLQEELDFRCIQFEAIQSFLRDTEEKYEEAIKKLPDTSCDNHNDKQA